MVEFVHPVRVEWSESDPAGILFYGNLFRWLDGLAHRLMREIGIGRERMLFPDLYGFAVVEAHCKFVAPAVYDDQLEVRCRVSQFRTASVRLDYRIVRPTRNGQLTLLATAYEWRILVTRDAERGIRSVDIPPQLRRELERFQEPTASEPGGTGH